MDIINEHPEIARPLCASCQNPFTQQSDVISNVCPECAGKAFLGIDPRPAETPVVNWEDSAPPATRFSGIEIPVEDYVPLQAPGPAAVAESQPEQQPKPETVAEVKPEKPANGKKPHHAFGDPTKPLWKDVVTGAGKNPGAIPTAVWESSVLWLARPFAMRHGWSGRELVKNAARAVRRISDQHPKVAEILRVWDAMELRDRARVLSLDKAIEQVEGISKDEFATLILKSLASQARATAKAIQAAAIPDMMAASMDAISGNTPAASSERVRHLETVGLVKQNKGQQIVVNASANANGGKVETKSFDGQLAELDEALDADYEMLPAAQPRQLNQ